MIKTPEETSQEVLDIPLTDNPIEELDRYSKTIDDLIEEAEIEAEIEATKKFRSKNTRLFTISVVGLLLMGFLYYKMLNRESSKPAINEDFASLAEMAEEQLQVPATPENLATPETLSTQNTSVGIEPAEAVMHPSLPDKMNTPAPKPLDIAPKPVKPATLPAKSVTEKPKTQAPKTASVKSTVKPTQSITKSTKTGSSEVFFIQLGAFSSKSNADKFAKRLTDKGFTPDIHVKPLDANRQMHFVRIGEFNNREKAQDTQKKLIEKGFKNSFIR